MHWSGNKDHRPTISDRKMEICTGVLMGDGYMKRSSKNPHLSIKMVNEEYLRYLDNQLGWLSNGVRLKLTAEEHAAEMRKSGFRPDADVENYQDVYILNTKCHPDLRDLSSWYDSGEKQWPSDVSLTPTVLTHWYVCDGHWANDDSKDYITISMVNEREEKKKIESMFEFAGLPRPSRWGTGEDVCYAAWTRDGTERLFEYMDGPITGFEYKFP